MKRGERLRSSGVSAPGGHVTLKPYISPSVIKESSSYTLPAALEAVFFQSFTVPTFHRASDRGELELTLGLVFYKFDVQPISQGNRPVFKYLYLWV